ncbi:hypothetical protein MNBD_GAMMA22-1210 [hydrothermal vent metagenome]|uniref:Transglutaminase-like domain-containing protein n=1 Tax=hydrothermal vent metagenome TaxID=652676 RepID=A0A3B0ZYD6_9ZZZZ
MRITNKFIVLVGLFSVIGVSVIIYVSLNSKSEYLVDRTIKYQYQVQNKTNKLIKTSQFWAYAPVPKTSNQLVASIQSSLPYQSEYDELGNHIQTFTIENLAPYATKIITLSINLKMSNVANPLPIKNKNKYLVAEKNIESDNSKLIKFSESIIKKSSSTKSNALFNWVSQNIVYKGYIKADRGALYAMNQRTGDCTEYSYLFTALSRAQKLSSRVIGGYVYNEDTRLNPEDFHNWSEYYKDNRWYIADTQNKIHNKNVSDYIAFRIIADSNNSKLGNSHRFAFSNSDIVVTLK